MVQLKKCSSVKLFKIELASKQLSIQSDKRRWDRQIGHSAPVFFSRTIIISTTRALVSVVSAEAGLLLLWAKNERFQFLRTVTKIFSFVILFFWEKLFQNVISKLVQTFKNFWAILWFDLNQITLPLKISL